MNYKKANEKGAVGKRRLLLDGEERRDLSAKVSIVERFLDFGFRKEIFTIFIENSLQRCRDFFRIVKN
jgi:hypothetical protein